MTPQLVTMDSPDRFDADAGVRADQAPGGATASARPARRSCAGWPSGWSSGCRTVTSRTSRASPACATSSARCPGASPDRRRRPLRHARPAHGLRRRQQRRGRQRDRHRAQPRARPAEPAQGRPRGPLRALRRRGAAGRAARGRPELHRDGLRGSRAYVKAHPGETKAMILLDYVGNKGLQLPHEGTSTPALWAKLRAAAPQGGQVGYFPPSRGDGDHRRPHAVPARPRPGDRPDRLELPRPLAPGRHGQDRPAARWTPSARPCSSWCRSCAPR